MTVAVIAEVTVEVTTVVIAEVIVLVIVELTAIVKIEVKVTEKALLWYEEVKRNQREWSTSPEPSSPILRSLSEIAPSSSATHSLRSFGVLKYTSKFCVSEEKAHNSNILETHCKTDGVSQIEVRGKYQINVI